MTIFRPLVRGIVVSLALVSVHTAAPALPGAQPAGAHSKAFWQRVRQNNFVPPPAESVPVLVRELSGYLASPDPDLRETIGYSVLAAWIYHQEIVPADLRRTLIAEWTANLRKNIGSTGTDAVFLGSFSARALGQLVLLDTEEPYLQPAEFDALLSAASGYLRDERDTRGFDPTKGWAFSSGYTADLLKALAASPRLQPLQQYLTLVAIMSKLRSTEEVFTHGEDDRLARVVLAIAARSDFDEPAFRRWTQTFGVPTARGTTTPASLAIAQNCKNFTFALYAELSADLHDLATVQAAREITLGSVKSVIWR